MSYLAKNYNRKKISFKHGKGSYLISTDGKKYLDFVSGIAVNSLGHANPKLVKTIKDQSKKLWHVSNAFQIPEGEKLAKKLCKKTFADKVKIATSKSVVDFGVGINVEPGLVDRTWFDTISSAFWKLYPYDITSEDYFGLAEQVLSKTKKPLVIHGEHPDFMDDKPLTNLADHTDNRLKAEPECLSRMPPSPYLHIAHLSTFEGFKRKPSMATSEVCPHHLLLNLDICHSINCKVDPPLRTKIDNQGLYKAFKEGKIPILASDHAPHTVDEKESSTPPSGMPGVETMVPLMLNEVSEGRLDLERLVDAMSVQPASRLGLDRGKIAEGQPADLIEVDLKDKTKISTDILHSKANWTPFEDWQAIFPSRVYRRGELIVDNGDLVLETGGQNLFS